ncbi:hypothetical protein A2716_02105 [candidate division WWE3 bacterium RIFCSPHIGHO2_01_FULL_40_23]|uniref:Uncharacterized protein n=1 Tax=candidate division WWE3 bacterium RIFCSPLOWO2_01_FULL_41_18 TaxID=1802625 RepID=A0A1F4VEV1_UNCKA|nr:MAG: hypothetical protein A2716_02105 [candidate division WWE3 bacterium RIFCSPHIGHO2_01_FULL_40_23]OGC55781.1 MAG: hypothetical protein A3A78_01955 [candidate division WWE3 bacterium RIFCSPLOWO2_01_FULL_41_18]
MKHHRHHTPAPITKHLRAVVASDLEEAKQKLEEGADIAVFQNKYTGVYLLFKNSDVFDEVVQYASPHWRTPPDIIGRKAIKTEYFVMSEALRFLEDLGIVELIKKEEA